MKELPKVILTLPILFFLPFFAIAHGGVQKQAGDVTVYLSQTPLSPLVGEEVKMTFVLSKGLNERLVDLDVKLSLIDTYFGDATKDQVLFTQDKRTDANGAFEFIHTFDKENYFDVDLLFIDPETGEQADVGFLVQPRSVEDAGPNLLVSGVRALVIAGITLFIYNLFQSKRKLNG